MRIEAYLLCWNEIDILEKVIQHYYTFCDKVTILDNHSTDGSAELAEAWACEVIPFGTQFFDDEENMKVKNSCWKQSKADWVIVADLDELLYWPAISLGMGTYFRGHILNTNCTIYKTIGWQIMSENMPDAMDGMLTDELNGFEFSNYAKSIFFNPREITEINYGPGAHECDPKGNVIWSSGSLFVLHYKHIGGVQRTIDRYKVLQKRLSKNNRRMGYGCHYAQSPARLRQEWNERMKISKPLI